MKIALSTLAVAALVAVGASAAPAAYNPTDGHVYPLKAQNGSGEYGTFALKPRGDDTTIEVHLVGAPAGVAQPAHVHMGSCSKLDPTPKYPLKSLHDGISETTLHVPMATLMSGTMAVNVHESAADLKKYVACGDITK